ncbi:hypothetical protein CEP54_009651 [Fusarium duplospermum]|uniref:Uncharacterized protein n=1 Tax=Fusarium duplospermum TaxID=1325734 RepID=A0A428PPJ5_9HYPO|nr:hypothetical protein CEP54_009651 [Fusarium duplospermum]
MANLITLPFELRARIFQYYFRINGGYVFNSETEKLTCADGSPIDLSLMYTCRSVAHDTKNMPLAVNPITFSTFLREDWRGLAGCFNYVWTYYSLLEADLVVRLARFMTPDMYSQLALKFPTFVQQIQNQSSVHEELLAQYESGGGIRDDPSEGSYPWRHGRTAPSWNFGSKRLNLERSSHNYHGLGSIADHLRGHPLRNDWIGGSWAIEAAMSCCLRLLSDKEPTEFARLVYGALPEWAGTYPAHEFLDLRFEPWAIPSPSEVAKATSRLNADNAWKLLEPWYHAPSSAYQPAGQHDPSHTPRGVRCREKIRFSAAASAIRFLQRLPVHQRVQIRKVELHEDHPSVGTPSTHVQGLAPFFRENPRLRVQRRVSMLACIEGRLGNPQDAARFLQEQKDGRAEDSRSVDLMSFPSRLAEWLIDAMAAADVGIPVESFTFVLEAGPHADFCTDLFQQSIHRDIAWYKANKACLDRGLVVYPPVKRRRRFLDEGLEEAVEHLLNQTSFLRTDFNLGLPWDFESLVEKNKHLGPFHWEVKWASREPQWLDMPPTLDTARMYSDNYEIQTESDYLKT